MSDYTELLWLCKSNNNRHNESSLYCMFFCVSVAQFRVVLTLASWLVFLYFFWKTGDQFPILSPKHGQYSQRMDMMYIIANMGQVMKDIVHSS